MTEIYVKTYGIIGDDQINKFGISPITDKEGNPHFGMFLVGMLTRILGGTFHVSLENPGPFKIIEIRIPVERRYYEAVKCLNS